MPIELSLQVFQAPHGCFSFHSQELMEACRWVAAANIDNNIGVKEWYFKDCEPSKDRDVLHHSLMLTLLRQGKLVTSEPADLFPVFSSFHMAPVVPTSGLCQAGQLHCLWHFQHPAVSVSQPRTISIVSKL